MMPTIIISQTLGNPYNFKCIFLSMPRELLFLRIDARCEKIIEAGLLQVRIKAPPWLFCLLACLLACLFVCLFVCLFIQLIFFYPWLFVVCFVFEGGGVIGS